MDNKLARFTKALLDVMFYIGVLVTAGIPVIFHYVGKVYDVFKKYYFIQCILYMICGVLCLAIIYELRRMLITVLNNNAFIEENAISLKRMGKFSFLIAFISIIRLPLASTPATVVVIIVFSIAGLFSIVLCQLFEKAVEFKIENDLTI